MSLFNTIVESTLNEIGAEDAYKRFYSEIPRQDYDKIVNGEKNIDKFVQFFLNAVREGFDANEAVEILNKVRTADNLVRQRILNDFKENNFIDPYDVESELKHLSNGDAVLSKKSFAKEGYVELAEDGKWKLTATLNYAANSHYYGTSQWCTASDRNGRYDGYEMFCKYSVYKDAVLFQFVSKEDIDKTIQVGINEDGDSTDCCNWADKPIDYDTFLEEENIPRGMLAVIYDNLPMLLEKERSLATKERAYQDGEKEFYKKRKELKNRQDEIRLRRLRKECEVKREKMRQKINKTWNYVVSNNLLSDMSLLNKIWKRDNHGRVPETTEAAMETYFIGADCFSRINENVFLVVFGTFYGNRYELYHYNEYEIHDNFDSTIFGESSNGVYMIVKVTEDGDSIEKVLYMSDIITNGTIEVVRAIPSNRMYTNTEKYLTLIGAKDGKNILFINQLNKMISVEDYLLDTYISLDSIDIISSHYDNGICMVDVKNGNTHVFEAESYPKGDSCIIVYPEKTVLYIKSEFLDNNLKTFEFDNDFEIRKAKIVDYPEAKTKFLEVENEDGYRNVFLMDNLSEPIFGKWGSFSEKLNLAEKYGPRILLVYRVKGNMYGISYSFSLNKYFKIEFYGGERREVECDKYGNTEQDRIAKRNFEKWQQNGGHSPEVLAQMDKMYMAQKQKNARWDAYADDDNEPSIETLRTIGNGSVRDGFKKYYNNKIRYNPRMNDWEAWDEDDEVEPRFDTMSRKAGMNESAQKMVSLFERLKNI